MYLCPQARGHQLWKMHRYTSQLCITTMTYLTQATYEVKRGIFCLNILEVEDQEQTVQIVWVLREEHALK
jgi:hypothetical protein